jgi:17beta-estradiol 17-dehydrogenase / very-long-chain 3-oxoacyl-CoA reductase
MSFLSFLGLTLNTATYGGMLLSLLKIVGFLKLLELLYRFWWTIKRNMRTTDYMTERYGNGSWAVITGGSDGIGLAMGKELARRHFNIVIVGRNAPKMADAARVIKAVREGT